MSEEQFEQLLAEAEVRLRAGQPVEARQLLQSAESSRACSAQLRELLIGEGDYESAAGLAQQLAAGDDVEARVSRAFLAMLERDLRQALAECQQAIQIDPHHATIHNHAGRALHNAGQPEQAVKAFQQAISLKPFYPEAWHNLGHVLRAVGQLDGACHAYEEALKLSPGYRSARLNLGKTLFNLERVEDALQQFNQLIATNSADHEALTDSGLALHLLGRTDEAGQHYQRALTVAENPTTLVYQAVLENELQDADAATASLQRALQLDPNHIEAWVELAGTHELCNRLEEAAEAVRRGLAIAPEHPPLQLEAAKLERRRSDFESASNRLQKIRVEDLPARLRKPYYFELASVLDRQDRPADAYQAYLAGNQLASADARRVRLNGQDYLNRCQRIEQWIEAGASGIKRLPADPDEDTGADLCFLHGFTRSGTTLLDMMLGVHPEIVSLEEVSTFEAVIRQLETSAEGYPDAVSNLASEQLPELRRCYRQAVSDHLEGAGYNLLVDKMPMRFIHSGLINRLFPDAKVLFALRHPCDVVLSNFMQQFPSTSDFLVNFDSLNGGAVIYDATFRLWQKLEPMLDLPVHYLRYEDLVADPDGIVGAICDFLGVEMTAEMLDTSARLGTRDRVITPSYQQVSEPLYNRAAERWRRYQGYLAPELHLLQSHINRYGYQS